jgi:hypothetical protein
MLVTSQRGNGFEYGPAGGTYCDPSKSLVATICECFRGKTLMATLHPSCCRQPIYFSMPPEPICDDFVEAEPRLRG